MVNRVPPGWYVEVVGAGAELYVVRDVPKTVMSMGSSFPTFP